MPRLRRHHRLTTAVLPAVLLPVSLLAGCTDATAQGPDAKAPPSSPPPPVHGEMGAAKVGDSMLPHAGNGGYDALHYALDLTVDPDGETVLDGVATLTARAAHDLSGFRLDLSGLKVTGVTVDGREAEHSRKKTELTIEPRRDIAKGDEFEVVVRYAGRPEPIVGEDGVKDGWMPTDDGALVMGEPVGAMTWYPVNNTLRDPATYDVALTVPDGLTGVANGRYRGKRDADRKGYDTFRWRNEAQTVPYLVTVAVGRFELKTGKTESGVEVVTAVDPRQADEAREILADIPEFIAWGEELFGRPYPYGSAGAIVDHQPENHVALETLGRPVYGSAPAGMVMAHEYAHQWVGNSVRIADWSQIWLNEGLATYAMWLWDAEHGGRSVQEWYDLYLDAPETHAVWSFPPAAPGGPEELFAPPVYYRGAMALHEVRQQVGDDDFFAILKAWASERAGKSSTIDQFVALAEQTSGEDLQQVFDVWLYQEGKPGSR